MYALAGSPLKVSAGKLDKWIKNKGMKNPNDFYPNEQAHLFETSSKY